jgi:hypothetical protein
MKIFQSAQATEWRPEAAHGKTVGFVVKTGQAPERGGRISRQSIFCRPIRGLDSFGTTQPTVLPWATIDRASGALVAMILFFVFGAAAATTNDLSDAEIQGRKLAQQLCEARPAESITNTGVLEIRDGKGNRTNYPVKCEVIVGPTNWWCIYDATQKRMPDQPIFGYTLSVTHSEHEQNNYIAFVDCGLGAAISNCETMFPFRHSDFWIADLGLEFFHWPEQKILKHEMRRGRACKVLESVNPSPSTNSYSRVVSWIDNESGGIVQAEAYDLKNKLLKEFAPKTASGSFRKWKSATFRPARARGWSSTIFPRPTRRLARQTRRKNNQSPPGNWEQTKARHA